MVYLIHFDERLHHAGHYIGFCEKSPGSRLRRHKAGQGARLTQVLVEKGITFAIVRVWKDGDRAFERQLKNRKNGPKLCPVCRAKKGG